MRKDGRSTPSPMMLTRSDVAKELRVCIRTVDSLIQSGDLVACKIRGAVRIRSERLEEYVASIEVRRTPPSIRDDSAPIRRSSRLSLIRSSERLDKLLARRADARRKGNANKKKR